jgi:thiosulfate reductase cytochrome b subunit
LPIPAVTGKRRPADLSGKDQIMSTPSARSKAREAHAGHPLFVRVSHWVNAFVMLVMILSGWRIYNASPLFPFRFPREFTLGGWLAGAIAWHFAAMWLLVGNGIFYLVYSLLSGHFRRDFLPISPRLAWCDLRLASRGRLPHVPGRYNALERLIYIGVVLVSILAVVSGLAIWKPVQFQDLTALMGGYESARLVHFFTMVGLMLFLIVHVTLAMRTPGLVKAMIRNPAPPTDNGARR